MNPATTTAEEDRALEHTRTAVYLHLLIMHYGGGREAARTQAIKSLTANRQAIPWALGHPDEDIRSWARGALASGQLTS